MTSQNNIAGWRKYENRIKGLAKKTRDASHSFRTFPPDVKLCFHVARISIRLTYWYKIACWKPDLLTVCDRISHFWVVLCSNLLYILFFSEQIFILWDYKIFVYKYPVRCGEVWCGGSAEHNLTPPSSWLLQAESNNCKYHIPRQHQDSSSY